MNEIDEALKSYEAVKSGRSKYIPMLEEAGKYGWPNAQDMVKDVQTEEGVIRTVEIYDSTAITSGYKLASGIFSYLMPVGTRWFTFKTRDVKLAENSEVALWLSETTDITLDEIWRSNFQREMFTTIRSMCVFGTGCISVEMSEGDLIFRSHHIADIFFKENSKRIIDTVFRRMFYTARQARQEFGGVFLGVSVEAALKNPDNNEKFEFVHKVFPRTDYDKTKIDDQGKKFKSQFINVKDKVIVAEGGFSDIPYLVCRFDRVPDEIMGRSPTIDLLPEIKMLNRMKETFIEGSEKKANPPVIVEDDGVIGQPATGANDIIYKRPGADDPKPLETGWNSELNAVLIAQQQQVVKDGYFLDLFQTLADYRNMTATEVHGRKEEGLTMLSSFVGSTQEELGDPLIIRVLELLMEAQRVKRPLTDINYDIVYQGRLAMAVSSMQANMIEVILEKWMPYQEVYPVLDNVDFDKAFKTDALASGFPANVIHSEDERDEIRTERKAMEDAQRQAEIAEAASKAYKNAGTAPQEGSIASGMVA